jgi:cell wall-associated NlpC family hydrolase
MLEHDPRLTPARPDLAAEFLRGTLNAARYVAADEMQVCTPLARLYAVPNAKTMVQTELLLGERFDVYEQKNGWAWGQAGRDGFVGFLHADALEAATQKPDHQISALRTPIFSEPDLKAPIHGYAHANAQFFCHGKTDRYLDLGTGKGWVFAHHTQPIDTFCSDWVAQAEQYLHTPYVWGGRSSFGLDCSALVQLALQAGGIHALRDSDMQQDNLGKPIAIREDLTGLLRGDLVFWKGHVGIMLDTEQFLHANAWHMRVAREPLAKAVARIQKTAGAITAIRRL